MYVYKCSLCTHICMYHVWYVASVSNPPPCVVYGNFMYLHVYMNVKDEASGQISQCYHFYVWSYRTVLLYKAP